jgi:hypothetical protein
MAPQSNDEALAALARTPRVVDGLLRGVAPERTRADEGPGTWSAFDVVCHLIAADATSWMPRAETIRAHGKSRPFAPPDPLGDPERFAAQPVEAVLDAFTAARTAHLQTVAGWQLSAADLAREGTHPHIGTVTLAQLFATWAVHDLTHVTQIARVLAWSRRDEVGAWRQLLSLLGRGRT